MTKGLRMWARRARECRNPLILARAYAYERQRLRLLDLATRLEPAQARPYMSEIEGDANFIGELRREMAARTDYRPRAVDFMLFPNYGSLFFNEVALYAIVRIRRPQVVVETGGTPGKSTAFMLRALERNGSGHLYTIDLPPQTASDDRLLDRGQYHEQMPIGAHSGWIVPDELRSRHTLLLGPSREQLLPLLEQLEQLDIFYHDSDHSYTNMTWEFATAFEKLAPQGLLLSDDVLDNTSFFDFCRERALLHTSVYNLGAAVEHDPSQLAK